MDTQSSMVFMSITTLTFASYQVIQKDLHAVMTQIAHYMLMSLICLNLDSANGIPQFMQLSKTSSPHLEQTNILNHPKKNLGEAMKHSLKSFVPTIQRMIHIPLSLSKVDRHSMNANLFYFNKYVNYLKLSAYLTDVAVRIVNTKPA